MAYAYVAGCDGAFEIRVQTSSPVDDTTTSAHAEEEANENGEAAAAVAPAHQPPTRVRVELSLSVDAVVMAVGAQLEPSAAGGAVLTLQYDAIRRCHVGSVTALGGSWPPVDTSVGVAVMVEVRACKRHLPIRSLPPCERLETPVRLVVGSRC